MKCTRCGVKTKRNALTAEADDVENSENGAVWLCDTCTKQFDEWLGKTVFTSPSGVTTLPNDIDDPEGTPKR